MKENIKLKVELVPSTSWGNNLRDGLSKKNWEKLKKQSIYQAKGICEICNDINKSNEVECHEIWSYDDNKKEQTLLGLQALCPPCHEVKHIGLARKKGRGEKALEHMVKVNKWTKTDATKYISECFKTWQERSKHEWKLNLEWLKKYEIEITSKDKQLINEKNKLDIAIENNDFPTIKYILGKNKKLNSYIDKYENHILHRAVETKNIKIVKLIISHPRFLKFINIANKNGVTPLLLSAKNAELEILKLLIKNGANIEQRCKFKRTILHYAALSDDFDIFKFVIDNFSEKLINEADSLGGLFFHRMMSSEKFPTQQIPVKVKNQRTIILEYSLKFLKKSQIIYKDKYGKTFVHCAAYFLNRRLFSNVLKKGGIDVINSKDKYGKTPINEAAFAANKEAIKVLIENNANFEHKSNYGETAYEIVERILGEQEASSLFYPQ